MSRLSSFFVGMVAGAALLHVATNYHVVRANDGVHLVAKQSARLSETYVDVRNFGISEWAEHPNLTASLVQANKQHLLGDSAAAAIHDNVQQLLPAWTKQ